MTGPLEKNSASERRKKKYMRGVCYDRRIGKFVATITVKGRRIYLGSFGTEDEAAGAHALARHDNPIRRGSRGSGAGEAFVEAFGAFLSDYAEETGFRRGELRVGAEFCSPEGQRYTLAATDTVHKPDSKAKWLYHRWHSNCVECGADFITSTMSGVKLVTGMTRTCPAHRKGGPRGDEPVAHVAALKEFLTSQAAEREEEFWRKETDSLTEVYVQEHGMPSTSEEVKAMFSAVDTVVAARRKAKENAKDLV